MTVGRAVALVAAVAVGLCGLVRGTWAIGGSDSSCYGLMADAFARGAVQPTSALANDAPWPGAALTFAPGGFIPSPVRPDAASPVCAPGFALLLAPLRAVGGRDAIFWLTPIAGALLVWFTFLFACRLGGPLVGAAAAAMVAAMPVLLFQVVQPMNDVVAATLWMAVLLAVTAPTPQPAVAGLVTGLALLVRPNLAPVAVVVAVWIARPAPAAPAAIRRVVSFGVAALPFVALAAAFNYLLYGHALRTGYGHTGDLFSAAYVMTNARNYGVALAETQLAFPLLALAAPLIAPRPLRGQVWLVLGMAAATCGLYLFYKPFPEWWYLRFLLPALAPLTAVATAVVLWATRWRTAVVAATVLVVAVGVMMARERQALDLWRLESRFRTAGMVARERLPENAVFITVWESGSVKYHAGREVVLWDSLDPGALDLVIRWLTDRGLDPHIMVEQWEEPLFRARFSGHSVLGDLDWPPRFDIERQVKMFRPADRVVYVEGGSVPTEYVTR